MNTKLCVDNLATTTENELMDLFSAYGNVVAIRIAVDRGANARSRGFVTMVTPEGARAAIQALNGKAVGIATITVTEASPNDERGGSSNGQKSPLRRASQLY